MKGLLPAWLERILVVDVPGAGEGTAWSLEHSWPLAPWATLLLVAAAVAWVVLCYRVDDGRPGRAWRLALTAARLSLVGFVLWMIAGFALTLERTGLPNVVVIVDDSASMGIADRAEDGSLDSAIRQRVKAAGYEEPTRLNQAKAFLKENNASVLREIERRHKLKLYFLAADLRASSGSSVDELTEQIGRAEPTGAATRLGRGLHGVLDELRGTPPAAVLLLSDGVNTEGESLSDAAAIARKRRVPIFTMALDNERPARDLEISDLLVDEVVFAGDVVNFEFHLTGVGLEGRPVTLKLREESQTETLATLSAVVGPDGQPQTLLLPYRPTAVGDFHCSVEIEALPEELRTDNNLQQRMVSVRKEQIRVLLAQSYPSFEFRYLKNMLQRDGTIELHTVLQDADPENPQQDRSALSEFPVSRDELFRYDMIVFGDVNPAFLPAAAQQNVADFVTEKGGGLVVIAGPEYTPWAYRDSPLGAILPVDFSQRSAAAEEVGDSEEFRPRLTESGASAPALQLGDTAADSQAIWDNLPTLRWLCVADEIKPGARVLAEHPTRTSASGKPLPIFLMQYVGQGKVVFHATDETWRWRYRVGDKFFARYWIQTIRNLSRAKLLDQNRLGELTVDRREYRRGEPVRLRLRFADERRAPAEDQANVTVEHPGHRNRVVVLRRATSHRGIFDGLFAPVADGQHHAWLSAPHTPGRPPAADFVVTAPPGELQRPETDAAALRKAAEETGGRCYTLADSRRFLADLPVGRPVPVESLPPIVLWNRWPVVAVFLTLLIGEWILRKRCGLL